MTEYRVARVFKRKARDFYPSPPEVIVPLIPHLLSGTRFDEPCAGNGSLIDALENHGMECVAASDIQPMRDDIDQGCVLELTATPADIFITNPAWETKLKGVSSEEQPFHAAIKVLSDIAPTWILGPAAWAHTKQATPFRQRCEKIVSIGRVSWEGNNMGGMKDAAWYLFDCNNTQQTKFYWRQP